MRERQSEGDGGMREITARNVEKVTRFRKGGMDELEAAVERLETKTTRNRYSIKKQMEQEP